MEVDGIRGNGMGLFRDFSRGGGGGGSLQGMGWESETGNDIFELAQKNCEAVDEQGVWEEGEKDKGQWKGMGTEGARVQEFAEVGWVWRLCEGGQGEIWGIVQGVWRGRREGFG